MSKKRKKQKRRPKIKDKKQSAQFIEAARELGADQSSEIVERIVTQMGQQSKNLEKK